MDKRLIFILLFALFLFPLVSAYQKEIPLSITVGCDKINCSLAWNITILNPNSSILIDNQEMIVGDYYASYSLTPVSTGNYLVFLSDTTGSNNYGTTFDVTYSSEQLSTSQGILYGSFFTVLVLFILVIFFIITKLPDSNERDEEGKIMSISYLKYLRSTLWFVEWLLVVTVLYLASNLAFAYMSEQLFASILFVLFRISLGITPLVVIVWVAWMFVSFFQDKQFQNMLNRGMFPQGRL